MTSAAVGKIYYDTWPEFKSQILKEFYVDGVFVPDRFLFRGAGADSWRMQTSFDRRFADLRGDDRAILWKELIGDFRQQCISQGVDPEVVKDEGRLLALGQHFGLPTRLLDWTSSPYVAAFFAFRHALTCPSATEGRVAIWVLDALSSIWGREFGVELLQPPLGSNDRLRNQGGWFTYLRTPQPDLESFIETMNVDEVVLTQVSIPVSAAIEAIPDLEAMGVHAGRLFPDSTGLAEAATLRATYTYLSATQRSAPRN